MMAVQPLVHLVGDGMHLAQVAFSRLWIWPTGPFPKGPARSSSLPGKNPQAPPCPAPASLLGISR